GYSLSSTSELLPEVSNLVETSYAEPVRFQARRLVEMGRVTLSFIKGGLERHLVVSGIVAENNTTYETKFTWKKEDNNYQAKCNCPLYVQELTCVHGAALWMRWQQFAAAGEEQKIKTS